MKDDVVLPTLLSQALVAFTIEFDNEFERQILASPYRPFLVSMVMWSNFMRFVPTEGIKVRDLTSMAGVPRSIHPSLPGMERWGYVKVEPDVNESRAKPPREDWIVRPTLSGQKAYEIWQALPETIEDRWRKRFGTNAIKALSDSLQAFVQQSDWELPHYLPVLMSKGFFAPVYACKYGEASGDLRLPTLLSQVLLLFTLDFERDAELSLPLSANVLRFIDPKGAPIRNLPGLSGVSKEATNMSLTFLVKNGFVVVEPATKQNRTKSVYLTPKGQAFQFGYPGRLTELEERWRLRFGDDTISKIRECLVRVISHERFSEGLIPPDSGWRAMKPYLTQTNAILDDVKALPQYPMVLHRGGYPDGS